MRRIRTVRTRKATIVEDVTRVRVPLKIRLRRRLGVVRRRPINKI